MRRTPHAPRTLLAAAAAVALALTVPAGPAAAAPPAGSPSAPVYLALGDSVAEGFGLADRDDRYVALLAEQLREQTACAPGLAGSRGAGHARATCRQLQLVDLSVRGATSTTLRRDQLPQALALLAERNSDASRRDDVRVITLTVGGNDVFLPVLAACVPLQPTCATVVATQLAGYAANLDAVLAALRAAAGPQTQIVATAYANSLPAPTCRVRSAAPLADVVLEGGALPGGLSLPAGLNDITRAVAARYDVRVAELYGRLGPQELADCLHPNAAGHAVYADAFERALGI